MSTKFVLRRRALGRQPELEIDEVAYRRLLQARQTLIDALAFEQRFDLLKENFIAFEIAVVEWSLRSHVEALHSITALSPVIADANRFVANLLSSAKAYVDQVKQDFSHLPLLPTFEQAATTRLSSAYDASKDFRFMEALRNHVQHRGSAVDKLSRTFNRDKNGWMTGSLMMATKAALTDYGKFKKSTLAEMDTEVDVRMTARGYVSELSGAHIDLRNLVNAEVQKAREAVEQAIADYSALSGDGAVGLGAFEVIEGALSENPVPVLLDWDDSRKVLTEKNKFQIRF